MTHHALEETTAPSRGGSPPRPTVEVLTFVAISYTVTWACFITAGVLASEAPGLRLPLLLAGSFAPTSVAVILTARHNGRSAVRELLGRLLRWRVSLRWYAFALGFFALIKLAVAVTYRTASGRWPAFGDSPWYAVLVAIALAGIIGGPLGEEVGWRGYALPRMTDRFGAAWAPVLLGLMWACWHLPVFVVPGLGDFADQFGQSFPTYVLQVTALSVTMAWLMNRTGGSLLLAVLMHSAINQTKDLVPSGMPGASNPWALSHSPVAWLTVAALWMCAIYFLLRLRRPR